MRQVGGGRGAGVMDRGTRGLSGCVFGCVFGGGPALRTICNFQTRLNYIIVSIIIRSTKVPYQNTPTLIE